MALEFDEDLDGYLEAFGVDVLVKGFSTLGIFRNEPQLSEFGSIRISGNSPLLTMRASDVTELELVVDDPVVIGETSYIAKEFQPDGLDALVTVRLIEAI